MNPGDYQDEHLEQALNELSREYRELEPEQPPEMLDQAVLNRARAAVEKTQAWPWNLGWVHTITTAAVVVIAVTLILQLRTELSEPPAGPFIDGDLLPRKPSPSEETLGRDEVFENRAVTADSAVLPVEDTAGMADKQAAKQLPVTTGEIESVASQAQLREEKTNTHDRRSMEQPVQAPAQSKAVSAKRAQAQEKSVSESLDPESWLQQIRGLKKAGDEESFRRELEAFKETFPDFPLPDDLIY